MNTIILFFILWLISGLATAIYILVREWYRSTDITVASLIDSLIIIITGPASLLIVLIYLIYNDTHTSYNKVIFRGRSKL